MEWNVKTNKLISAPCHYSPQEPVPPPDLFPPDMESLLGGVEEERREQADTTSDNLKTIQSSEHGGESHTIATHPETIHLTSMEAHF